MKEKAPAYQRYAKQILGDDVCLAMDWDAYGMHNFLLDISWQQSPQGTIPNDHAVLRRWLRHPSDDVWRRVWPQISAAWPVQDCGRLGNRGMIRAAERSCKYRENVQRRYKSPTNDSTKGVQRYEVEDEDSSSLVREEPKIFDCSEVKLKSAEFNADEMSRLVWERLGLAGAPMLKLIRDCMDRVMDRKKLSAEGAGQFLIDQRQTYESMKQSGEIQYAKGPKKFFEEGDYLDNPEEWKRGSSIKTNGKSDALNSVFRD